MALEGRDEEEEPEHMEEEEPNYEPQPQKKRKLVKMKERNLFDEEIVGENPPEDEVKNNEEMPVEPRKEENAANVEDISEENTL